jgi:hypothetical protein
MELNATTVPCASSLLTFGPDRIVEVGHAQRPKWSETAHGDTIRLRRIPTEERSVIVLSDGLGSGVKASVLSSLTATMAMEYATSDIEPARVAGIIMRTLPECSVRKIRYATFTAMNVRASGGCELVNYDNPGPFVLDAHGCWPVNLASATVPEATTVRNEASSGHFELSVGQYLIAVSDGVTQAGMGSVPHPLGWGEAGLTAFLHAQAQTASPVSARDLARRVVGHAALLDGNRPKDDISCAVVYLRRPRRLLITTGPPIDRERDPDIAATVDSYPGTRVIAGGTTANLVARELNRPVTVNLAERDPEIPPTSAMEGVDLIIEGTITMSRVADHLEDPAQYPLDRRNGASVLARIIADSDEIHFLVGTKINEAHQNPSVPVELEIRRNLMKRLRRTLEEQYLKRTHLHFV